MKKKKSSVIVDAAPAPARSPSAQAAHIKKLTATLDPACISCHSTEVTEKTGGLILMSGRFTPAFYVHARCPFGDITAKCVEQPLTSGRADAHLPA